MIFKNTYTGNWEGAFRGMRFPMNSNNKADTKWYEDIIENERKCLNQCIDVRTEEAMFLGIGPNDMDLAQRLIKAGPPHDKFLRQIFVSVDITAPLYLWKELDQYKVGTVTDSASTMHKLSSTPITRDCFEMDDFDGSLKMYDNEPWKVDDYTDDIWDSIIDYCETLRQRYIETKDERYWKELLRILPESWLQKRHWSANYSVVRSIVKQRDGHRLSEWEAFIDWARSLPYAEQLLFI